MSFRGALLFLAVVALPAWPQTWTGATDNRWSTATNWVGGVAMRRRERR